MLTLGLIPARKGSQGIPKKNMIDLGGRPLLDYTLEIAEHSSELDRVLLSTDFPRAIEWTRKHYSKIQAPFLRPDHLSGAAVPMVDVVLHAVDYIERFEEKQVDYVVLLQPTSPFRKVQEIDAAISLCKKQEIASLIGVTPVWHHPSDYVSCTKEAGDEFSYIFRKPDWKQRQDFPEVFFMTGALYICQVVYLKKYQKLYDEKSFLFTMSEETMIDIDSPFDLKIARGWMALQNSSAQAEVHWDKQPEVV